MLVAAARFGVLPGMVAALASFAAYNFLFVEPLYTLRVTHAADVAALAVFLLTAGLTGWLAAACVTKPTAPGAGQSILTDCAPDKRTFTSLKPTDST